MGLITPHSTIRCSLLRGFHNGLNVLMLKEDGRRLNVMLVVALNAILI
jgi:hypothetical protein